jgi:hypothetical protein
VDRDRAVDESGNQIAVFGRIGAGPLRLEEQQRMYLRDGAVWKASDNPFSPIYADTPDIRAIRTLIDRKYGAQPAVRLPLRLPDAAQTPRGMSPQAGAPLRSPVPPF